MDQDIKDLIILIAVMGLTAYGAYTFQSQSILMLGIGGGFTYLGVKYGTNTN